MRSIRVLIADDQRLFAASLKTVLETMDPDIQVVGIAGDGQEALSLADELSPSMVLMDVRMPVLDGVEATRLLKFRHPQMPVLMLTTFEDEEYVRTALGHGALGYLLKNIPPSELVASIRTILSGAMAIDPRVMATLLGRPLHGKRGQGGETVESARGGDAGGSGIETDDSHALDKSSGEESWTDYLNRKERHIVAQMVRGLTNKEIARTLYMAEQTVRNYVSRIYEKAGVKDRVEAIRKAKASGQF